MPEPCFTAQSPVVVPFDFGTTTQSPFSVDNVIRLIYVARGIRIYHAE